jgi:hypothetical protein
MRQRATPRFQRKPVSRLHLEALEDRRLLSRLAPLPEVHPPDAHAYGPALVAVNRESGDALDGKGHHTPPAANGSTWAAVADLAWLTDVRLGHSKSSSHGASHDGEDGPGKFGGRHAPALSVTLLNAEADGAAGHAHAHRLGNGGKRSDRTVDPDSAEESHAAPAQDKLEKEEKVSHSTSDAAADQVGPVLVSSPAHQPHSEAEALLNLPEGREFARAVVRAMREATREEAGHGDETHSDQADPAIIVLAQPAAALQTADPAGQFTAAKQPSTAVVVNPEQPGESLYLPFAVPAGVLGDSLALVGWRARQEALAAAAAAGEAPTGRPVVGGEGPVPAADAGWPLPRDAGLATGALATDTALLHEAIRRFLGDLDTAGRELTRVLTENSWVSWVVVAGLAAVAAEAARRRLARPARTGRAGERDEPHLSGLSGSYPFPTSSF